MDSPESAKDANTTNSAVTSLSESPQVQESPFFRYINNLSPIKPVKAVHLAQGFSGFSSPPPLFTSPRISSHRGTQFLKRPQCCQSPSAGISQNDDGGKNSIDNPDDFNKSNSLLLGKFITDNQKGFDIKNDENTQNCSSSLCVDEFLADPVDIDGMYSVSPSVKQSNDAVESSLSDLTHSKETISKYDNKNGLIETEESKEVHLENPTCDDEPRNIEGEKNSIEWSSTEIAKLKSNLSAELLAQKQHCEDSSAQCAVTELRGCFYCTPKLMPESLQVLQECEDCGKMGPTSHVCAENMMQDGSEASLKHRGLLRRCLQFEEAASTAFGSSKNSLLPAHIPEDSRSSATSSESKNLKVSHMTTIATSSKRHMVKFSESNNSSFSPQLSHLSGNVPLKSSKPSGIGLHLNSIVNAMPLGCAATTEMSLAEGSMGQQAMKTASSISLNKGGNINRCLIPSDVNGKSSVYTKEGKHEIIAPMASGSVISESPSTIDSSNMLNPIGHPASINGKRKLSSQDAGYVEEFNQPFPEKKRKKTSSSSDDDGCKRCNCKKSKCLKLYCDCFAAGIYCAEPCACQGCFNRPEYEETVLETRQQIESRNPLAFAPKIVQHATEIPSNNVEAANLTTPSSARHKRGCNCKRSMCLKKYCECYQANVGCSTACRCDGCKNVYGRKEDFFATEHALSKERLSNMVEKGSDSTFHKKLEMVANKADLLHAELYDLHNLSPLTPSLQCSDEGKEAAKSRLLAGKYLLPSPHSDVSTFSSHGKFAKSPKNSEGSLVVQETNEMVGTAASYDLQSDCNNVEILDQSSRRHNLVTNTCQLTPLSNPSLMALPSISSKARDCTTLPQSQLSHGSTRVLSGSSLRWRSSPITPMTRLGETKHLQSYESDSRRLSDILEDETPEVLKETSTPTKSVKASSPNQKRVSPPHHAVEPGSISSGGLRSGRKFILKAVPSFPPLTPCMDSEGTSNTSHDNSGTNSSSK